MAAERWRRDRQRRDKLASMNPLQYPGRIVRRVIVITNEIEVREVVLYDTDSYRDARRKLKQVMA